MLFVVVSSLRFTGACVAILFYGVSSQAFSIDRSIGGRVFGAMLWTGAFLMGGILAFAMTSLAWVARGAGVVGILTVPGSDARGNLPTVSAAYYVLVMVLHMVCSFFMSRPRAMEAGFMETARGTLSHVYLSVVTTMAVLMPLFGQELYWTQNIGSMLKAITITMAGAIVGPVLVYVQSSHDNVRRRLAACMVDVGVFLTGVASGEGDGEGDGEGTKGRERQGMQYRTRRMTVKDLIGQTALIEMDLMCCALEPPWPLLTSQVGADFRLYAASVLQLQKLLGSANALSCCVPERVDKFESKVDAVESKVLRDVVEQVAAGVSASLAAMAVCLDHMPLARPCGGDSVAWRPMGDEFWASYDTLVTDGYQSYLSENGLGDGACRGISDVLKGKGIKDHAAKSPLVSLAACEMLIKECVALETWVARALGLRLGQGGVRTSNAKTLSISARATKLLAAATGSPYTIALYNDLTQATSYSTWVLQVTRAWWTCKSVVHGRWMRLGVIKQLLARRDIQFYIKFFIAINSALVAIVLIEWLGYGNGGSAADNATSMANFYSNWQPEYFLTATVICMQKTVEISVVKALLRTTMIAVGGVLGYVTMLNGTLASNAYFVLFIVVAVNGFFGLFSIYGMDFRYSLFLMVYTFNGVVACQYTGVCCQAGTVLEFGGKAVSTCLGAIWAMIWSILIMPMYTSEVVLGLEKNFLAQAFVYLGDSWRRVGDIFETTKEAKEEQETTMSTTVMAKMRTTPADDTSMESVEKGTLTQPQAPASTPTEHPELLSDLLADVDSITKLRIGSFKAFAKEVTLNSLDKRELHFVQLNLIPLPQSVHLVYRDLTMLGSMVRLTLGIVFLPSHAYIRPLADSPTR